MKSDRLKLSDYVQSLGSKVRRMLDHYIRICGQLDTIRLPTKQVMNVDIKGKVLNPADSLTGIGRKNNY